MSLALWHCGQGAGLPGWHPVGLGLKPGGVTALSCQLLFVLFSFRLLLFTFTLTLFCVTDMHLQSLVSVPIRLSVPASKCCDTLPIMTGAGHNKGLCVLHEGQKKKERKKKHTKRRATQTNSSGVGTATRDKMPPPLPKPLQQSHLMARVSTDDC